MSILQSTRRPPLQKPMMGDIIQGGHPLLKNMQGCWLLNEGYGKIANSLVNSAQMRLTNSGSGLPSWNPVYWGIGAKGGVTANEMRPDSSASVADLPLNGVGFTILFWMKAPGNNVFIRKTTAGTNNTPGWTFQNNGSGGFVLRLQTTGAQCNRTTNNVFPTAEAFQVAWVYNGAGHLTAANHSVYMNGIEVSGYAASNNGSGTYNSDAGNPLSWLSTAGVDHFIIWDRALLARELIDLYVDPFRFMAPNQRSRIYQVGGLTPHRKPFIFVVT